MAKPSARYATNIDENIFQLQFPHSEIPVGTAVLLSVKVDRF